MMNPVPWLQMTNMISYQGLVRTFPNCLLSSRLLPMVEKTPNGVVIKVNDNFVSFVATKDDALKEQLFAEIRTALA